MTENTSSADTKQVYELGFHIVPTVSEDTMGAEYTALKAMVEKYGGAVQNEQTPELVDLAYTMTHKQERGHKHYDQAYFGWIVFEGTPEMIQSLEEDVREQAHVLRYILVKTTTEQVLLGPILAQAEADKKQAQEREERKEASENEKEEAGEVSEEEIDKSLETLVGDVDAEAEKTDEKDKEASA